METSNRRLPGDIGHATRDAPGRGTRPETANMLTDSKESKTQKLDRQRMHNQGRDRPLHPIHPIHPTPVSHDVPSSYTTLVYRTLSPTLSPPAPRVTSQPSPFASPLTRQICSEPAQRHAASPYPASSFFLLHTKSMSAHFRAQYSVVCIVVSVSPHSTWRKRPQLLFAQTTLSQGKRRKTHCSLSSSCKCLCLSLLRPRTPLRPLSKIP